MTELLRRAPDSNAPLAQECFRLLAALLRACASYKVRVLGSRAKQGSEHMLHAPHSSLCAAGPQ